ncbi:Delta-60 repeat domain-containing protein [Candidatus Nitrotoga sp. M5]|nr:Delta-60 repeat domain-containing protein [Candidatus Nitrotoga sp. M5]
MLSLLKVFRTVATKKIFAIFFALIAFNATMIEAHAAPVLDSSFGSSGIVRIGVPAGAEDKPSAYALQRDGKLLLAGWTSGRQSHAFVLRLLPNGVPDPSFGLSGVALFDLPNEGYYGIQQLEQGADGSILINGSAASDYVLTRLTAAGDIDTSFGTQGFFSMGGTSTSRFVQQSDGGLLIVSDVTQGPQFALQLTRLTSAGVRDSIYAPNGEKILSGLPPDFGMASGVSVVAEPDGGFTVMARATFSGGTYLLLRVTAAGTLNPGFGNGGLISGYDVGNPFDQPVTMVRTANGGLLLMGDAPSLGDVKIMLWRVTTGGLADASFGTTGRLEIGSSNSYNFRLAALSDGSIALAKVVYGADGTTAHVSRFDASGVLDSAFGAAGIATIALADYILFSAIGVLPNGVGGLLVPAAATMTSVCYFGPLCVSRGADVAVASLDGSGRLQTNYGRGDGFAVVNNAEYSNDTIDSILVETSGKVVLAGTSDADATFDYMLERLTANGSPDIAFGTNGRVAPRQYTHFMGKVRAAEQESGAITVVTGTAAGSAGQFGRITAFQLNSAGVLDAGFAPALAPPSNANMDIALAVRPDGRLLYGTTTNDGTAVLQQTMSDGTPDLSFGAGGKIEFPLSAEERSRYADLVLLGDGSVIVAVLTNQNLRLYKVDSHGLPVASFGTGGKFAYVFADPFSIASLSLLSLSDGSLLAGIRNVPSGSSSASLLMIRISSNGLLIGAHNLFVGQDQSNWSVTALPDASVVIAGNRYVDGTSSAALYRLLPNNSFDTSFGIGGAFPLPGMLSVEALALDANSRLLVAGQDATSAVLARYDLSGALASMPVVEFYNTNLDHYFITADATEAAAIDEGSAGPGWIRTGNSFKSGGSTPICRFYGSQIPGPNSHFYTLAGAECDGLKQLQAIAPATQKRWNFESLDFISSPPTNGVCPTGSVPVYRAYNNGFARGVDSNHRISSTAAAIQDVIARGWIDEGVVMCAPI